jgi:outer membrane protein insertion porin family
MKKFMLGLIGISAVMFLLMMHCADVSAAAGIKLGIIPFSLEAEHPSPEIQTKITRMILEKLKKEGIATSFLDKDRNADNWDFDRFRELGIKSGTDYILTGSIFIVGKALSIESTLINVYDEQRTITLSASAEALENLLSAVERLDKDIIAEIYHKKIITDIVITGNKRVESDAIQRIIKTKPGDIINPDAISKDLRNIYDMGYFDDIVVEKQSLDNGVKLVFRVSEKPSVRKVRFKGNSIYKDKEIDDIIATRTGSILNIHTLNSDVDRIRAMYTEKNYHNCSIKYEIKPLEHSQADIIFRIKEGNKLKVEKITFEGNHYFSDKKIKKVMEISEKGFFSFITNSGDLNETEAKNDAVRIESLYKNNGFIDAKVSDPIIDIGEKSISIHFKIDEGPQYKVKKINITGDLIVPEKELFEILKSKADKLYNRKNIRKDILSISDIYSNRGFANVNVTPLVKKDETKKNMVITYFIKKGDPVHFNRVNISGNLKTRDKVIRREIKIVEQDLYSKENIQKSYKNLNRLNYFSNIEIKPVKTSKPNEMDLDVKVEEKQTGSLSLGGGFSSEDGGFLSGSVEERNLFGRGQNLKFSTKISHTDLLYNISFFEPYINDTPVSGGIDLYKEDKEYDYYDKEALGMSLRLGYRLFEYTRVGARYNIEDFKITNVQPSFTNMTPGSFLTSSIRPYIKYDSRDDFFLPTEGMMHKFSVEYAGEWLGGDIDYTKYLWESGFVFPLFWKFTGILHAEAGYLDDRSNSNINIDYVRFYLGGINSIRGFDKYDISGKRPGDVKDRGGEKYTQFNAEVTFPFTEEYKVAWVFFYDRGDVYRTSENIDLGDQFSSFGTGIRWNSPVGPIRIEYGWVIDGKDVKSSGDGQFEFSVGAFF